MSGLWAGSHARQVGVDKGATVCYCIPIERKGSIMRLRIKVWAEGVDFTEVGGHEGQDTLRGGWADLGVNYTHEQAEQIVDAFAKLGRKCFVQKYDEHGCRVRP